MELIEHQIGLSIFNIAEVRPIVPREAVAILAGGSVIPMGRLAVVRSHLPDALILGAEAIEAFLISSKISNKKGAILFKITGIGVAAALLFVSPLAAQGEKAAPAVSPDKEMDNPLRQALRQLSIAQGRLAPSGRGALSDRSFDLLANHRYLFTAESEAFDAALEIFPADPAVSEEDRGDVILAMDDDGGDGQNALLDFSPLESGRYTVRLKAVNSGSGTYQFTALELPPLPAPARPAAVSRSTLAVTSYRGALTSSDPIIQGRRADDYLIPLAGGKPVLVIVDGEGFDPVARILNADDRLGDTIREDDDSAGERSPGILFTPGESGNYVVRVTASGPGERGTYLLRVGQ